MRQVQATETEYTAKMLSLSSFLFFFFAKIAEMCTRERGEALAQRDTLHIDTSRYKNNNNNSLKSFNTHLRVALRCAHVVFEMERIYGAD